MMTCRITFRTGSKAFSIKNVLLAFVIVITLPVYSASIHHQAKGINQPAACKYNVFSLPELLSLTPKRYFEVTGKRMSVKEKIAFAIIKAKLKKQLRDEGGYKTDMSRLSLMCGISAFVIAIIPIVGVLSFFIAIAAIVFGIIGLRRKSGNARSIIGIVLGSLFLIAVIAIIASFASVH